ncbi:MAG TPA: DoxX family protein [Chitinophagaceae bacterium]|nr:DoxX family protein [Chitinophagaceae bacterium]
MKKEKIIYWTTTLLLSGMMLFSAVNYLIAEEMKQGFAHLGFSDAFRIELAIAKILGAAALLLPQVPYLLKQFAYFGFALTFISASIAHAAAGDPVQVVIMPVIFLGVLAVSYYYAVKLYAPRWQKQAVR